MDILLSIFHIFLFLPFFVFIYVYIFFLDGSESIIKQDRVGLHGKQFKMYKFRTMKKDSHELRDQLGDLNKNDKAIFKIENDPRIIKGSEFLRRYSLKELSSVLGTF